MDYSSIVEATERKYGLTPGLLASVWEQESNQSDDLGLPGPALSRGRGRAVGPFQIVPYYHPGADLGTFESQADYAAKLLSEKGLEGYYGTGTAPAGHPTPQQYRSQVMGRLAPDVRMASVDHQPGTPTGDPRTGRMDSPVNQFNPVEAAMAAAAGMPQGMQLPAIPQQQQAPKTFAQGMASDPLLMAGLAILGSGGNIGAAAGGLQQAAAVDTNIAKAEYQKAMSERMARGQTPSNIKSVNALMEMGLSRDEALRLQFPTGTTTGRKIQDVGGVSYITEVDEKGDTMFQRLPDEMQGHRETVLSDEARATKEGQALGDLQVKTLQDYSGKFSQLSQALSGTERALSEFESGRFDGVVGPVRGRITRFFDPEAAVIGARARRDALANLNIANLAPVTDREMALIEELAQSPTKNVAQNIALLKEIRRAQSSQKKVVSEVLGRMAQGESVESIMLNPPVIEYAPGQGQAKSIQAQPAAGGAVRDEFRTMLDELPE